MPCRSHARNHLATLILLVPCIILATLSSKYLSSSSSTVHAQASVPSFEGRAVRAHPFRARHVVNSDPPPVSISPGDRFIGPFVSRQTKKVTAALPALSRIARVGNDNHERGQATIPPVEQTAYIQTPACRAAAMWFFSSAPSGPVALSSDMPSDSATEKEEQALSSTCATATAIPAGCPFYKPLFPPFDPSRWHAVDDRVRGGSSVSHLESWNSQPASTQGGSENAGLVRNGNGNGNGSSDGYEKARVWDGMKIDEDGSGARFWGHLDTQTLGGAGFASQSYTFTPRLSLPETSYKGLQIILAPNPKSPLVASSTSNSSTAPRKPDMFTLVLKSDKPGKREDGRRESVLTYEYTFSAPELTTSTIRARSSTVITMPWSDFSATYRGRKIDPSNPMYVPLRPGVITKPSTLRSPAYAQWSEKPLVAVDEEQESGRGGIYEMSLMCRSDFGKQEGDFELFIVGIGAERVGTGAWGGVGAEGWIVRIAERMGVLGWMTRLGVFEVVTKVVIGICAGCQWVLRFFSQAQESSVRLP